MSYGFGRLNELCDRAYNTSKEHGFWDTFDRVKTIRAAILADYNAAQTLAHFGIDDEFLVELENAIIAQKLALITSEVAEALEAHRESGFAGHTREDGKPEGWGSELADVGVRLGDLATKTGVNLEQEWVNKADFNDTRPRKHGKRY